MHETLFSHEKEVVIYATTWKNLKNMELGERSQRLYDSSCVECPPWGTPQRQEVDWWLPGAREQVESNC
jgi:hypothetical protein